MIIQGQRRLQKVIFVKSENLSTGDYPGGGGGLSERHSWEPAASAASALKLGYQSKAQGLQIKIRNENLRSKRGVGGGVVYCVIKNNRVPREKHKDNTTKQEKNEG